MYYPRLIDSYLLEWKHRPIHKPILIRGARQVGKSWSVRHLGATFENFVEINLEKNPELKAVFRPNLDAESRKLYILDTGLMLRVLDMWVGDAKERTALILTGTPPDLVNKGNVAEMLAGLEMKRYHSPNMHYDLYYWQRDTKNSQAEIDYLYPYQGTICPIEVKSGTRGGMKSLWIYMREKSLMLGVRSSLENFGTFDYLDRESGDIVRHVRICPLYAISQLSRILE